MTRWYHLGYEVGCYHPPALSRPGPGARRREGPWAGRRLAMETMRFGHGNRTKGDGLGVWNGKTFVEASRTPSNTLAYVRLGVGGMSVNVGSQEAQELQRLLTMALEPELGARERDAFDARTGFIWIEPLGDCPAGVRLPQAVVIRHPMGVVLEGAGVPGRKATNSGAVSRALWHWPTMTLERFDEEDQVAVHVRMPDGTTLIYPIENWRKTQSNTTPRVAR